MDLAELPHYQTEFAAVTADLPDVDLGVQTEESGGGWDAVEGAFDATADADTSVLGVATDVEETTDYMDEPEAKAPVDDRHRAPSEDDMNELLGMHTPAAAPDERNVPYVPGPGGAQPPGPPGGPPWKPPIGGGSEFGGDSGDDDNEGNPGDDPGELGSYPGDDAETLDLTVDPELARLIGDADRRLAAAYDAINAPLTLEEGFGWLAQSTEKPEPATDGSDHVTQPDEIDRLLYGEVTLKTGQVVGVDVTSPDFTPPTTTPADATIYETLRSEVESAAQAPQTGPDAEADAELAPAALVDVGEVIAEAAETGVVPEVTAPDIDPQALQRAARLSRWAGAGALGRKAAEEAIAAAAAGQAQAQPAEAAAAPDTADEPYSAAQADTGATIEMAITVPDETAAAAPAPADQEPTALPARTRGAALHPRLQETSEDAGPQESVDEMMLRRVLSGLRGMSNVDAEDPEARQKVGTVELSDEEIADAGGDISLATANKLFGDIPVPDRPAGPPASPPAGGHEDAPSQPDAGEDQQ